MAADKGGGSADPHEAQNRPAFLELFFDLAFVFVLTALAEKLFAQLSWSGAGQTLVLLLAFTLLWAQTSWAGDLVGPTILLPRVLWVMVGVLVMGAMAGEAYGSRGLQFALTYVAIHLGTGLYMLLFAPPTLRTRNLRILFWFALTGVGWLVGGVETGTTREVLWAAAIVLEYVGTILDWPAPGSWRPLPGRDQRIVGERVAERYRQFVIIALGVSILVTGNAYARTPEHTIGHAEALVAVFLIKVLIWRIYSYRAGEMMATTIAGSADPAQLNKITAFLHLVMVAGIVGMATTSRLVIDRPFGDTPTAWAAVIIGGPAVFLIGRVALAYVVFTQINWSLVGALVLLGGLAPATALLPPVTVAIVVVVILLGMGMASAIEYRQAPVPTPHGGRARSRGDTETSRSADGPPHGDRGRP
ncbi:low temperature requirement protein A [Plantactinospora sp. B5E13]|uniref:low temperature requirement protein A n=1 Tax=unclassified Plantactinospora TaxID=2631981 RepID=UPI00325CF219